MLKSFSLNIKKAWDSFWFVPISTKPLSIFRIFFGIIVLQYALLLIPDLFTWLGNNAILSSTTINSWQPYVRFNILNLFPDNDIWLSVIFAIFFLAAFCLTIGFRARLSATMVFLCLISFHARNYLIINSGDNLMRLFSLWLIFSPAGNCFSVDHWLKKSHLDIHGLSRESQTAAPWAQRLMQINMALVYAHTFSKKITGIDWQNGTAVYYSSRLEEMHRLPISYVFDHLWTCQLLTWGTLIIEFSLFSLIWVKPIRYYVIALGILMHLTIDWSMNIPQFQWIMIMSYILFIEPADLDTLFTLIISYGQILFKKLYFN